MDSQEFVFAKVYIFKSRNQAAALFFSPESKIFDWYKT